MTQAIQETNRSSVSRVEIPEQSPVKGAASQALATHARTLTQDPYCYAHTWRVVEEKDHVYYNRLVRLTYAISPFSEAAHDRVMRDVTPALEPTPNSWIKERALNEIKEGRLENFGYAFIVDPLGGADLILPKGEAIQQRFECIRKTSFKLRPLKLCFSDGIATSKDFIKALIIDGYDFLLASGKEFVHDHIYHVSVALLLMLEHGHAYYDEMERIRRIIRPQYERLEKIEKEKLMSKAEIERLWTILGATVDLIWAGSTLEFLKSIREDFFENTKKPFENSIVFCEAFDFDSYKIYWSRTFPGDFISSASAKELWKSSGEGLIDKLCGQKRYAEAAQLIDSMSPAYRDQIRARCAGNLEMAIHFARLWDLEMICYDTELGRNQIPHNKAILDVLCDDLINRNAVDTVPEYLRKRQSFALKICEKLAEAKKYYQAFYIASHAWNREEALNVVVNLACQDLDVFTLRDYLVAVGKGESPSSWNFYLLRKKALNAVFQVLKTVFLPTNPLST